MHFYSDVKCDIAFSSVLSLNAQKAFVHSFRLYIHSHDILAICKSKSDPCMIPVQQIDRR